GGGGVGDANACAAGEGAHARRCELAVRVRALAESVVVRVVDVAEIDRRVRLRELNVLEREHAAVIIERSVPAKKIIADGARMFRALAGQFPHLEARDRAEEHHVAVAAASIVAKTLRDELFRCIARRYEPEFGAVGGWGYENAATHAFLREYWKRYKRLPPEARRSWQSWDSADYLPKNYKPFGDLPAAAQVGQLTLTA